MSILLFVVLMLNGLDSYTPSDLQFSSSKLFFQHQNQLLQNIGFISPMSIDTHFKYTFQEVGENYFIEGGEFEGLTIDHDVHEQGIIYKIGFLHPKFQNVKHLSVDLSNSIFDAPSMLPLLGGLLGWAVIFGLLAWLYNKGQFWHVLFWLNLIGGLILFGFLIWRVSKVSYNKIAKTKSGDYGGLKAKYTNQDDTALLSSEVIRMLKYLRETFWITKFCYTGNCIYLLQDVHDHEGNRVSSSSKLYSEQEKASLQQKTINYIHQSDFLSLFSLN